MTGEWLKKLSKWSLAAAAIFLTLIVFSLGAYYWIFYRYQDRIYPNVSVAGIPLSGLSHKQALDKLNKRIDIINQEGFPFSYHQQKSVLLPLVSSIESDLAYQTITFDAERAVSMALQSGRTGSVMQRSISLLDGFFHPRNFPVSAALDEKNAMDFLAENFAEYASPAKDARLQYERAEKSGAYRFSVKKEEYGMILDYDKAIAELKSNLAKLHNGEIPLQAKVNYPEIYEKDCLNIDAKANRLLGRLPIYLRFENDKWELGDKRLAPLMALKVMSGEVGVGLDLATTSSYLRAEYAPKLDIEPVEAKFEYKDGKVQKFQLAKDGRSLDAEASAAGLEQFLMSATGSEFELAVKAKQSELSGTETDNFGIKEIIGTGHSNFSGSPKNRRHNIKTGANAVNGTLIKPGEEFSLLKTLGKIDASTGYLPELVIKENKTTPEFGGGLCQIGTTVFRGTVASGLPVTSRRNHSYRVSYYEPAGTDATIYDPWPDYRFVNDTKNYILIQSRIKGDDLYFDFWGMSDGRIATSTYPTIYNIVKPGPTKIIETDTLKPGEKKCTEKAHNGADAYFDYKVIYSRANPPAELASSSAEIKDEDLIKKTRFKSHYVPWREVCLVGVDKTKVGTTTNAIK